MRENKTQGNGTYTDARGFKHTGYFKDGKFTGQFLVEFSNGDIYRGDLNKDEVQEGKGVYTWPSGDRYEGEWRADKINGQGVFIWGPQSNFEGYRYEGEWRDGRLARVSIILLMETNM